MTRAEDVSSVIALEETMRLRILAALHVIAALLQSGTGAGAEKGRIAVCINTAAMPTAQVEARDRMPILRPDTSRVERMPVSRRNPCYLSTPQR